jgi:hypothetical protein
VEDCPVWLAVLFCFVLPWFSLFIMRRGKPKQRVYATGNGYEQDFGWTFGAQVALALSMKQLQLVYPASAPGCNVSLLDTMGQSAWYHRYLPGSILPAASLRLNSRESNGTQTKLIRYRHDTPIVLHIDDFSTSLSELAHANRENFSSMPIRASRVCSQACPGYHGYFAEPTSSYPGASAPVYMQLPTSKARE